MIKPTVPVTCGEAIDVPSHPPSYPQGTVLVMFTPGAPRSTVVAPQLEKAGFWSLWSVAATEMIPGRS